MIKISKLRPEEGVEAVALILSLFEQYIARDYTDEGSVVFRDYVTASSLVTDDAENFALVATVEGSIVGIAKIKRKNHLSMLFVSSDHQGRGLGRRLLEAAMSECIKRDPEVVRLTTNSSRFGFPFFIKQGFKAVSEEAIINGVRFTPMAKIISCENPRRPELRPHHR